MLDGAAVLAYFFVLTVFPAAIFVLSLLPYLSIPHLQQAILDLLYQVLPQQSADFFEVTVRYVASQATEGLFAATVIALASTGFRFYVSKFGNYSAEYGNLAAMIILMLWMYMAGIALLVGCEINAILHAHKSRQAEIQQQ